MLGAIDTTLLVRVLDALADKDAPRLVAIADEMATRSFSFAQGLRDLASLLHRIALVQRVPGAAAADEDADSAEAVTRLAQRFAADEVQLYYQIALHGRNDLHLAPDDYAGFTMTLLRMLAFAPDQQAGDAAPMRAAALVAAKPPRAAVPAPAARSATPAAATSTAPAARAPAPTVQSPRVTEPAASARAAASNPPTAPTAPTHPAAQPAASATAAATDFDGNWPVLVTRLPVQGLPRQLAAQAELIGFDGDTFRLRVPNRTLADANNIERLRNGLSQHFGRSLRISVEVGATAGPTAAGIAEQARADRQRRAEESIRNDPTVQQLIQQFGAQIDPSSIRPND
jgi:DNA polymerase-3 subunit gamma/tau